MLIFICLFYRNIFPFLLFIPKESCCILSSHLSLHCHCIKIFFYLIHVIKNTSSNNHSCFCIICNFLLQLLLRRITLPLILQYLLSDDSQPYTLFFYIWKRGCKIFFDIFSTLQHLLSVLRIIGKWYLIDCQIIRIVFQHFTRNRIIISIFEIDPPHRLFI